MVATIDNLLGPRPTLLERSDESTTGRRGEGCSTAEE
jgi:hypothetical protein